METVFRTHQLTKPQYWCPANARSGVGNQWYIKNYGPEVNLFVDHSQIVQLEALQSGIWGAKSSWGRIHSYKGLNAASPCRSIYRSPIRPAPSISAICDPKTVRLSVR